MSKWSIILSIWSRRLACGSWLKAYGLAFFFKLILKLEIAYSYCDPQLWYVVYRDDSDALRIQPLLMWFLVNITLYIIIYGYLSPSIVCIFLWWCKKDKSDFFRPLPVFPYQSLSVGAEKATHTLHFETLSNYHHYSRINNKQRCVYVPSVNFCFLYRTDHSSILGPITKLGPLRIQDGIQRLNSVKTAVSFMAKAIQHGGGKSPVILIMISIQNFASDHFSTTH